MTKYEYKITAGRNMEELNSLGEQGWAIVGIFNTGKKREIFMMRELDMKFQAEEVVKKTKVMKAIKPTEPKKK